jgi:hypothetical protein
VWTSTVAAAVGAAAGAGAWSLIARRAPAVRGETVLREAPALLWTLPTALVLLGAQAFLCLHPDALWYAPSWIDARYNEALFAAVHLDIAFLFGLATRGAFATRHPQRLAPAVAGAIILGSLFAVERDATLPIADSLHDATDGDVVMQTSGSSCAAASAANLARAYGVRRTEREMAELIGTTQ